MYVLHILTLIMLRLATHTHHVPVFSSPAFSTCAIWSCVLHPYHLGPRFPVLRFLFPRFQRPHTDCTEVTTAAFVNVSVLNDHSSTTDCGTIVYILRYI